MSVHALLRRLTEERVTDAHRFRRDTSNAPEQITNRQGFILLRKGDLATPGMKLTTSALYRLRYELTFLQLCSAMGLTSSSVGSK